MHRSSQVVGPVRRASRANDRATACSPRVEVFDRALAVDPRQRASRHVQDRTTDQFRPSGRVEASPIEIAVPEQRSQPEVARGELSIIRGGTDRLEQEMTQEEPQVERRVARMRTLEIEQNQAS